MEIDGSAIVREVIADALSVARDQVLEDAAVGTLEEWDSRATSTS